MEQRDLPICIEATIRLPSPRIEGRRGTQTIWRAPRINWLNGAMSLSSLDMFHRYAGLCVSAMLGMLIVR
jgi:hypothetical protein